MQDADQPTCKSTAESVVDRLVEEIVAAYHRARGQGRDLIRWLDVDACEYHARVDGLLREWYGVGGRNLSA
jgi:hypothetical protein